MKDDSATQASRQTFLAVVLALLAGGAGFVFLVVVTGGFFLYVLVAMAGFGFFGYLHYLLWGRSLSREVEDAGDVAADTDAAEFGEWPVDDPPGPHRL